MATYPIYSQFNYKMGCPCLCLEIYGGMGRGAEGAKDIVYSLVSFTKGRLPVVTRRLINSGEFRYQPRFLHLSLSHKTLSKKRPFLFNIGQVARRGTDTCSDWLFHQPSREQPIEKAL